MTMKTKLMILIYLEKILKPILRNILTLKTVKTMEMKPTNLKSSLKKSKKKSANDAEAEPMDEVNTEPTPAPEAPQEDAQPAPAEEPAADDDSPVDPWGAETEEAPGQPAPEGGDDDDPWSPELP